MSISQVGLERIDLPTWCRDSLFRRSRTAGLDVFLDYRPWNGTVMLRVYDPKTRATQEAELSELEIAYTDGRELIDSFEGLVDKMMEYT